MSKIKNSLPAIILISLAILFAYFGLQESFFEQDEWHSFGYYNYLFSLNGSEFIGNVLRSGPLSHFTPLSLFFKMELYRLFGLNSAPYFLVSIFLHILVSISVYVLILLLTKKKLPAFIGSLFFAVNSSHHQAVTWLGTFDGTESATLFGVLALVCSLLYLEQNRKKFLYFSLAFILVALLFKETAITFLLVMVGLTLFAFREKRKGIKIDFLTLGIVPVSYLLLRFVYLIFGVQSSAVVVGQDTKNFLFVAGYNFITTPVKIFTQILAPNETLISFVNSLQSLFDKSQFFTQGPWVLESVFKYDLITLFSGMLILVILFWLGRKIVSKLPFYMGVALIILTTVPFLIFRKYLVYLDSRYLYPASVGFGIVIGSLIASFGKYFYAENKIQFTTVVTRFLVSLVFLVILIHVGSLKWTITQQVEFGRERKEIINKITKDYSQLPQKAIFFVESDTSYYGLPESDKILPFQSGFGQTLLVSYYQKDKFPVEFFLNDFLWGITDQGYKEINGRGFGYYRDFDLLKNKVKEYRISGNSVIAYSWDSKSNTLTNITEEVRAKLND